jgi:hypothetical protein
VNGEKNYIATVQGLPAAVSARAVTWLESLVTTLRKRAADMMPSLQLQKN